MGAGWTNCTGTQQFSCSLTQWPSSTRAELAAIWTVLLTVPADAHAIVYTDSQAAIDGIKEISNLRSSRIKWFDTNNPTLKLLIKDCLTSKRLRITLIKVKGHSNNELNDLADRLAKEGLYGPLLTLDFNLEYLFFNLDYISFRPYWDNKPIEHRLRPFIK